MLSQDNSEFHLRTSGGIDGLLSPLLLGHCSAISTVSVQRLNGGGMENSAVNRLSRLGHHGCSERKGVIFSLHGVSTLLIS